MDILVIYNQQAGSDKDELALLKAAFKTSSHHIVFKQLSHSLKTHIERAIGSGCRRVVAAGGDGTINAVVNVIMRYPKVALGIMPMGTLNHFAKELNIPQNMDDAAKLIVHGHTRKVDIAKTAHQFFLNNASFGVYPQLVKRREQHENTFGKWLALCWAFIKVVPKLRRYHMAVQYDGKEEIYRTPFIFIGNNQYGVHRRHFTKRRSLTQGVLAVYILQANGVGDLLRVSWRALSGSLAKEPAFTSFTAQQVTIRRLSGKGLLMAFDGEAVLLKKSTAVFCSQPKALRIIASAG